MPSEKVFVLGLDGASPDVINTLIREGRLPNFRRLKDEGVMGNLRTTIPPITGSAWSSFMTGNNPGKHGIFDFIYRKEGTYDLSTINASLREGRSFWSRTSAAGRKVCILNVPVSYPPEEVNGIMVSGMMTPSGRTDYTFPAGIAAELDRVTGGYEIHIKEAFSRGGEERFLAHLHEVTEKRIRAMEYLFGLEDWDLFVVIFQGIDVIQHELWHCSDPGHFRHDPSLKKYLEVIPDFYRRMDDLLGQVMKKWTDSQRTLVVMSDHGAGPLKKLFYVNNFLMRTGFLKLRKGPVPSIKNLAFRAGFAPMTFFHLLLRMGLGKLKKKARFGQLEALLKMFFLSFEDVDWNETKAYAFGSTAGQIYLNLKGREPRGIVLPGAQFEAVRDEIILELRGLVDEENGEKVVSEIYKKEDLYHGPRVANAPDIVFLPRNLEIAAFGESAFASHRVLDPSWGVSGSHRMDGLVMMKGRPVRRGVNLEGARIIDLAPTILYLMGLPVPEGTDGRILGQGLVESVLREEPPERMPEQGHSPGDPEKVVFSEGEEEELKDRLKSLGYLL